MSLSSFESRLERDIVKRSKENLLRSLEKQKQNWRALDFSSNDYFALAKDQKLVVQFEDYISHHGFGSGASRLISGNHDSYLELEQNLALSKKTETALVFGSGYLAAIGVIPNICGKGDLVIADKYMHRSALDAIKLSGAKLIRYVHNDNQACANILKVHRHKYANCLIVSETLFSMDGDYADVIGLYKLAKQYDSLLLVDDAHGLGVFTDYPQDFDNRLMVMGTLSKALGSYGGYLACSNLLKSYLVNNAASLIYSTALPDIAVAWANHALLLINQQARQQLLQKVALFCAKLGIANTHSPIIIIPYESTELMFKKKAELAKHNILVGAIRPPTTSSPRLRITISLRHSEQDLEFLASLL